MSENMLVPVDQIQAMAVAVAKSGLFGMKTPEQAMALMLIAQAEGMHPAIAARDYHVIQGRPALKADAMLARFLAAGGKVEWKEYTDTSVVAVFSHPAGGTVEIDWTIARAKAANLAGKDTWKQYPRQMLRARVISEGIRTVYPGASVGIYTPEEVQDFEPQRPPKDITPVDAILTISDDQAVVLAALIKETKADEHGFLTYFKADSIGDINAADFGKAKAMLEAKRGKKPAEKQVEEKCAECGGFVGFCNCAGGTQ